MNKLFFLLICCPSLVFSTILDNVRDFYTKNRMASNVILIVIPCIILSYPLFISLRHVFHVLSIRHVLHKYDIRFAKEDGNYDKMILFSVIAKQKGIHGLKQALKEKGRAASFRYMCNISGSFSDAIAEIGGMTEEDIIQLRHVILLMKHDD